MKYARCDWCLRNVAAINVWANVGLFAIKLLGGILGMSRALLADAVHSIADVIVSVALWATLKISTKPADSRYPYGRGNIEFITSGFLGILLMGVAIFICVESYLALMEGDLPQPGLIGVMVAFVSIMGNWVLSRHSFCIGNEVNSPALIANAREKRADVFSSSAALIGIVGARLGFRFLDPVAAIIVGILIAKIAISTLNESIHGLLGSNLGREDLERTNRIAASVEGVERIYSIKTHRRGQKVVFDLEIGIDPETELKEGISISELIKSRILHQVDGAADVNVYLR